MFASVRDRFRSTSIRRKLAAFNGVSIAVALTLASSATFIYGWLDIRRHAREEVGVLADMLVGLNSSAIAADDTAATRALLSSLRHLDHIRSARIYTRDGRLFAEYTNGNEPSSARKRPTSARGHRFIDGQIALHRPVFRNGERLATILVVANVKHEIGAIRRLVLVIFLLIFLSTLSTLVLTQRLQRHFWRPVLHLAHVAERVRARQDYTLRAAKDNNDELGQLVDAFNGMLAQIQQRDIALLDARSDLEKRVVTRTSELSEEVRERERVEAQLRDAKEAAEIASRTKSAFLANMSHEIRTPMNGIIGMTRVALETELSAMQRHYLETVAISAESLLSIINDILDFSKIEAGHVEVEHIEFDLLQCVDNTLGAVAIRAQEKGIELICCVRPDTPRFVATDPLRLRQILMNLVGNAIKFTSGGEIVVEAKRVQSRSLTPDAIWLQFAVRDTGIGIPREKLEIIFDEFAQVDESTTRQHGGTGLGLSISRRLVEMLGGRLWARSTPGEGSAFYFTIRAGVAAASEVKPVLTDALKGLRVLIVDHNRTSREFLGEVLTHWRMLPTVVGSGPAAIVAIDRAWRTNHPYSLLIVDGLMPGTDGIQLVEQTRADQRNDGLKIVMLSSNTAHGERERFDQIGVEGWLRKPIQQSELFDTLIRTVSGGTCGSVLASHRHDAAPAAASLNVLLTEDNTVNQELAALLLEQAGHRVTVAWNGREALDAIEAAQTPFDVVLMDVQMPVMGGFEATTAIREKEAARGERLPIIGLTAHAMKGDREKCLEAGMDDYVTKPIDPEKLFEALESILPGKVEAMNQDKRTNDGTANNPVNAEELAAAFGGSMEILDQIVRVYLETAGDMVKAIESAVASRDHGALQRGAHSFKGAVSNFQAAAATEAARRLEYLGRDEGNWDDIAAALTELVATAKDVERALRDIQQAARA